MPQTDDAWVSDLCLDASRLSRVAGTHSGKFRNADPFPHVVIDGLFSARALDRIAGEVPPVDSELWRIWGSGDAADTDRSSKLKRGISEEELMGPVTRTFLNSLNSSSFVRFLERLTGNAGLLPDPSFAGGGLHCTGRGGRLLVHVDRDRHPVGEPLNQMVNVILFLNKDWPDEFGGHLELWSADLSRCVQRVAPLFNRMVVFESGTASYHGHPTPLSCPEDRYRLSLATYYYVANRPVSDRYVGFNPHVGWVKPTEASTKTP